MGTVVANNRGKRFTRILFASSALLMIPLFAMQFTNEVDWSIGDFLIMGILLFGTGTLCEIVFRKTRRITYRVLFTFGLLLIFFFDLGRTCGRHFRDTVRRYLI